LFNKDAVVKKLSTNPLELITPDGSRISLNQVVLTMKVNTVHPIILEGFASAAVQFFQFDG